MTRIHTVSTIIALAAALAASSAQARPIDHGAYDAGYASTAIAKAQQGPKQDLRGPDARDAARPILQVAQPIWPADPQLLDRPVPEPVAEGGDGVPGWAPALAAALVAALAAAVASRISVRRRQEARLGA